MIEEQGNVPPATASWLLVAGHVDKLMALAGMVGMPSLVKIDGLREDGRIYTVLLDGTADAGCRT
ncbi:hypothetical protein ACQKIE_16575 [Luteibacter sp. NPDC031894]|jgi:hypothetical protein|uniref:hypothetical protein n=1 Tax=Luteibacter sp. NPDC031894 TaxID=3390572 RepID=UPI003CFDEBF8